MSINHVMMKGEKKMQKKRNVLIIGLFLVLVLTWAYASALANPIPKPPEVIDLNQLPIEPQQFDALRKEVNAAIDAYSPRMNEMTKWMYENPESGYMEHKASKMMGDELEKHGFVVKYGIDGLDESYNAVIEERFNARGLPTALVAKYKGKSEHPIICFMFEADALRRGEQQPFHGCQHNMQGPVALGSAINLAKIIEKNNIPGSIWVILTPAEEIPPPDKSAMAKAGVFDEVDFLIRNHGTASDKKGLAITKKAKAGLGNCCYLIHAALYDFYGKTAHGSRAWQGARDSLDAARLFFNSIDMLREHSEPEFRFMGAITKTATAPNVICDHVQLDHWIRHTEPSGQEALNKKIKQLETMAKGTAMATFNEVKIRHYADYYNGIEYAWAQALWWKYLNEYGDKSAISDELDRPKGWAEGGYPSVNTPGITIAPAVANIPKTAGHSDEGAAITISPEGYQALNQMAKIGTSMALQLILDPELLQKIKDEQKQWQQYALENGLITQNMIRKK